MSKNIEEMNIFEKMSAISMEIGVIEKNLEVDGRNPYKAVFEGDVIDAVKPFEAKYHVFSYPAARRKETETLVREYYFEGSVRQSTSIVHHIETIYRFVNMDKPDEFIEVTSYGDGIDTGDKAPGKGMTYSDKYALIKAYKLSGGKETDPDSMPSPDPLTGEYVRAITNPMQVTLPSQDSSKASAPIPEANALAKEETPATESVNTEAPKNASAPKTTPAPAAMTAKAEPKKRVATTQKPTKEAKHFPIPNTYEEAVAMPVEIGQDAGKGLTFGLLYNQKPNLIRFYATDADLTSYPEVKKAAQLIIEEKEK